MLVSLIYCFKGYFFLLLYRLLVASPWVLWYRSQFLMLLSVDLWELILLSCLYLLCTQPSLQYCSFLIYPIRISLQTFLTLFLLSSCTLLFLLLPFLDSHSSIHLSAIFIHFQMARMSHYIIVQHFLNPVQHCPRYFHILYFILQLSLCTLSFPPQIPLMTSLTEMKSRLFRKFQSPCLLSCWTWWICLPLIPNPPFSFRSWNHKYLPL